MKGHINETKMSLCHWKQLNVCLWICCTFALCIVGVWLFLEKTQTIEIIGKVPYEKNTSVTQVVHSKDVVKDFPVNNLSVKDFPVRIPSVQDFPVKIPSVQDFPVKIPSDDELGNMTATKVEDLYWDYINTIQSLCQRVVRIGTIEDGGKEVCADELYRPRPPCLVYSFGINNAWDFDEDAARIFGCEVFCFDPSMRDKGETYKHGKSITFYMIGLGEENDVLSNQWKIRTLERIRSDFNHTERTIDLLKIDIEGSEWNSIPQMVLSGTLRSVRQMQIELHGRGSSRVLKVLRMLYEDGFRIFMRDRNLNCKYSRKGLARQRTSCMEISLFRVF